MTEHLLTLIRELQTIEPIQHFALAGGTNLAIRFNHRKSDDIDLFTNRIIGIAGWENIMQALQETYREAMLFCSIINKDEGNQFCFLRALIKKGDEQIKVDMIQNVQQLDAVEKINGITLFSIRDIGVFKLLAASNRYAKKDIYDLDVITDNIDLAELLVSLKDKLAKYNDPCYKCLFDLDLQVNPLDDINSLLAFDKADYQAPITTPSHSNDRLVIMTGKSWIAAKFSWKRKIKNLQQ